MNGDRDWDFAAELARSQNFSGAFRVAVGGDVVEQAFGLADRERGVANSTETQFAIASGTKLLTALAVGALIDDGDLSLTTPLVDVAGTNLGHTDSAVTIDHLLSHRSGIYDYYDEDAESDFDSFELPVPPADLNRPSDYLPMLFGAKKFDPGERFSYCNGGYVLLGIVIESVSGRGFHDFVADRVLQRAGMTSSGFFRFDALPATAARGYVEEDEGHWRTNETLLPIIGGPDGGAFMTLADCERLWRAFFAGEILSPALTEAFLEEVSIASDETAYGRGVWIDRRLDGHFLEGADAGVSFKSFRTAESIATVISNTSEGAWPIAAAIADRLD